MGGDAALEAEDESRDSGVETGGGAGMGLTVGRICNPTIRVIWLDPISMVWLNNRDQEISVANNRFSCIPAYTSDKIHKGIVVILKIICKTMKIKSRRSPLSPTKPSVSGTKSGDIG